MNPKIFDVNKLSLLLRSYFQNYEELIFLMIEFSIFCFLVLILREEPYFAGEVTFPSMMRSIILSTSVILVGILYGPALYVCLGVLAILAVIATRILNYLIFIFRTPYYTDAIWPEE